MGYRRNPQHCTTGVIMYVCTVGSELLAAAGAQQAVQVTVRHKLLDDRLRSLC